MDPKTTFPEAPQTDDFAAIEQWHENQEAQAGRESLASIAVRGAVAIECHHGYDACPACDEVVR